MFIEKCLAFYTARLMQRYLTFEKYSSGSPPKPNKDRLYLLYIHIPFCEQLCPYCSFVKVEFEHSLASRYFDALEKEIEIYHKLGYRFDSIYIGGGTPTIMPDRLARMIEFVTNTWQIKQISVETNPNHLTPEILRVLANFGVNRLSVGVQSFNDGILRSVQRLEKYGSGEEIKDKLCRVNGTFDTLNVDMIFNFPNQTDRMLAREVEDLKEIKVDQITYYPLMVSNESRKELRKSCGEVDYRQEKQLYKLIVGELADTYDQQSVWCFSRKNGAIDEYIIDHDEYVGLGPGSWGYINGAMYSNTFSIHKYMSMLEQNKHPVVAHRGFSPRERMHYDLLLNLLDGNMNLSHMKKKYGGGFWLGLGGELLFLLAIRVITLRGNTIRLTSRGRYYCLMLMRNFFSLVADHRDMRALSDTAAVHPG